MPLKRLNIADSSPSRKGTNIPEHRIEGDLVGRYNKAVEDAKDAKARVEDLRNEVLDDGLDPLFEYNIEHDEPVSSLAIIDENGDTVRLTFQNKYSAANPEAVEAAFTDIRDVRIMEVGKRKANLPEIDINAHIQETLSGSFSSKIFNGKDGRFEQAIYDRYAAKIAEATAELIEEGVLPTGTESPLTVSRKVVPLDTFHTRRWKCFPDTVTQNRLFSVLPNTVTLTPVA